MIKINKKKLKNALVFHARRGNLPVATALEEVINSLEDEEETIVDAVSKTETLNHPIGMCAWDDAPEGEDKTVKTMEGVCGLCEKKCIVECDEDIPYDVMFNALKEIIAEHIQEHHTQTIYIRRGMFGLDPVEKSSLLHETLPKPNKCEWIYKI